MCQEAACFVSMMTNQKEAPRRLRRASRACDDCHRRSVRCRTSDDPQDRRCRTCIEFDQECTYNRTARRRGVKPRSAANESLNQISSSATSTARLDPPPNKSGKWQSAPVASQAVVMDLVEIYFEVVYPIFPYFHRPTFIRRISRGEYTTDRYLFAATMAICALVSGRVRDGALFNPRWDTTPLLETPSEVFYNAATRECRGFTPADAYNLNLLRASALLAIASIQVGDPAQMQLHLGRYHTLFAMSGFHDETQWPKNIGIVETEERRRVFWSVYTLELYTSIVWNSVARCREQQCNVSYPTELDDEQFDDTGYRSTAQSPLIIGPSPTHSGAYLRGRHWLAGWNFTTDLYRVLEHVITHFRDRRKGRESFLTDIFGDKPTISGTSVRDSIMRMYTNLPQCFKETSPITCDMSADRYGFQAANITATVQLLRMVLFTSGGGTIEERCQIASEVVNAFMCIPVAYLQAISSPLLHHLAGIGSILGSVLEEPLNQTEYQSVRSVLLSLAQLLQNMDNGVHSTNSAEKLRSLVARIDEYMESRQVAHASEYQPQTAQSLPDLNRKTTNESIGSSLATYAMKTTRSGSAANKTRDLDQNEDTLSMPFQLPADLLDDWPWTLDFMQFPEA